MIHVAPQRLLTIQKTCPERENIWDADNPIDRSSDNLGTACRTAWNCPGMPLLIVTFAQSQAEHCLRTWHHRSIRDLRRQDSLSWPGTCRGADDGWHAGGTIRKVRCAASHHLPACPTARSAGARPQGCGEMKPEDEIGSKRLKILKIPREEVQQNYEKEVCMVMTASGRA
jgi:hypothetical protein